MKNNAAMEDHWTDNPRFKQHVWVGLTDEEIKMWRPRFKFSEALIKEVEAKLKEKNYEAAKKSTSGQQALLG